MSDEDALLRAILDRPDDDLPRLVLADWLDEHGEGERAEFIRVQCAIWRLGNAASWYCDCDSSVGVVCEWCQDREPLQRRERTLFGAIWDRWFVLPELQSPHPSFAPITMVYDLETRRLEYHIRRGFVESVACDLRTFAGGPCECFTNEPDDGCPVCKGDPNYRTPGIAPRLFASQPVRQITLSDVRPMRHRILAGHRYGYELRDDNARDAWQLPAELWRHLPKADFFVNGYRRWWWIEENALDALSAALVAYGRANAEGHRHGVCWACEGYGTTLGCAGDRSNPKCADCDGTGSRPGLPPLPDPNRYARTTP